MPATRADAGRGARARRIRRRCPAPVAGRRSASPRRASRSRQSTSTPAITRATTPSGGRRNWRMPAIAEAMTTASPESGEEGDLVILAEGRDRELLERLRHDVDHEAADREDRAGRPVEQQGEHLGDRQEHRPADHPRKRSPCDEPSPPGALSHRVLPCIRRRSALRIPCSERSAHRIGPDRSRIGASGRVSPEWPMAGVSDVGHDDHMVPRKGSASRSSGLSWRYLVLMPYALGDGPCR